MQVDVAAVMTAVHEASAKVSGISSVPPMAPMKAVQSSPNLQAGSLSSASSSHQGACQSLGGCLVSSLECTQEIEHSPVYDGL